MADEPDAIQKLRANADLAVEQLRAASGIPEFGYDAKSVEWTDGFIERQRVREATTPDFFKSLTSVLGSYLGECIVRTHGGKWALSEEGFGWCVKFGGGNVAYPFAKVQKQFANGREGGDSIYSFFTTIPVLFQNAAAIRPRDNQTLQRTEAAGWFTWIRKLFGRGPGQ